MVITIVIIIIIVIIILIITIITINSTIISVFAIIFTTISGAIFARIGAGGAEAAVIMFTFPGGGIGLYYGISYYMISKYYAMQ